MEMECLVDEHLAEIQIECARPSHSQDVGKIKQLIISTYEHRRSEKLI
jgi:hypothetical protein